MIPPVTRWINFLSTGVIISFKQSDIISLLSSMELNKFQMNWGNFSGGHKIVSLLKLLILVCYSSPANRHQLHSLFLSHWSTFYSTSYSTYVNVEDTWLGPAEITYTTLPHFKNTGGIQK